ncbi:MAG: acyltransferase [Acidobacteriota bacterium]|nr:acyltransferase [Acidobacteriota bacterium]
MGDESAATANGQYYLLFQISTVHRRDAERGRHKVVETVTGQEVAMPVSALGARLNNFGIIRLILAVIVCLGHLESILPRDYGILAWPSDYFGGNRAVDCFFVISGYLIFRSCRRSTSLRTYALKRARRLYPALFAAVLGSTILGAFITRLPLSAYLSLPTLRYIACNLCFATFLAPTLPGVFEQNRDVFVNGPLWTLKIELMFYCAVPAYLWLARRIRFETLALVTYIASVAFRLTMNTWAAAHPNGPWEELGRQLPGQLSFFMAGALIENNIKAFRQHVWWLLGAAAVMLLPGIYLLYPAALGIIVIWLCVVAPCVDFTSRFGDYSYGLYVTHFPIIQTFAALGILSAFPALRTVAALAICAAVAVLSWHFVELPALQPAPSRPLSGTVIPEEALSRAFKVPIKAAFDKSAPE